MAKEKTNSDSLFIHRVFKGIAKSAIELLIPLIIYKKTGNIQYAFLFAFFKCFITAISFLILKKFIRKNAILSILISILPLIIAEFLLNLEIKFYVILILALLAAMGEVLYYGGVNIIFSLIDSSANSAKFDIGFDIGQIIFIILSSYILGNIKNSLIFVVIFATVMHILCIVPLVKNYKQLNSIVKNIPKNNQMEVIKNTKYFNLYHFSYGLTLIFVEVALPLYLAITGLSFTAVGIFMAAGQMVKIISSLFAKFMQNKGKDILCIILCSCLLSISLAIIIFVKNSLVIYIFNLGVTFAAQGFHTIIFVKFVKSQVQNNFIYDSVFYRDFCQNSGRTTSIIFYLITSLFPVMFGIGLASSVATGIFGCISIQKVNNQNKKMIETPISNQ